MPREQLEPSPQRALQQRMAMVVGERDRRLGLVEHPLDPLVKLVDDGQKRRLLAVEVKIERAAGDLGARDDVTDVWRAESLCGRRPSWPRRGSGAAGRLWAELAWARLD